MTHTPAEVVRAINRAWTAGDIDALEPLFHEDVVMLLPGGKRSVGRPAMLASFREYVGVATTHAFDELELSVDVTGPTAVATLKFRVDYEIDGRRREEVGTDVMALSADDEGWRVVWRTQIPEPPNF